MLSLVGFVAFRRPLSCLDDWSVIFRSAISVVPVSRKMRDELPGVLFINISNQHKHDTMT